MSILALMLSVLSSAVATPHPAQEQVCTRWEGTASGNDPSVRITATLCDNDGQLTGMLAWKSDRSGTSTRTLQGTRNRDAIELRDTSLSGAPNAGWRFCTIDRYTLAGAGTDSLSGKYVSYACNDHATIALHRVR